jgi:hypothetical protein
MLDGPLKYMLNGDQFEHSLQELDETVASVGGRCDNMYNLTPTRRRYREPSNDERSSSSATDSPPYIAQHPMMMNRQLIDNIDTIKCKSQFARMSSSCSRKSFSTKGSRLSRSISSRSSRRRGASLERTISQVIAQTSGLDVRESHSLVEDSSSVVSTDDILKDLIQADAVWTSEVGSVLNLLPPIETDDEPELLPPIQIQVSSTPKEWQPNFDDASFPSTPQSRVTLQVPVDTPETAMLEKSSMTEETYPETVNVSDETLETSIACRTETENLTNLFGPDPFGDWYNEPSLQQLPGMEPNVVFGDSNWMPFDENPFHDDNISHDSPSSVADFGRLVDRVPTNKSDTWLRVTTMGSF